MKDTADRPARAIRLAVRAHIRHRYTPYDDLFAAGRDPAEARSLVHERIEAVLASWAGRPASARPSRS